MLTFSLGSGVIESPEQKSRHVECCDFVLWVAIRRLVNLVEPVQMNQ